ncbi:MAG: EutN/CcmL family microcompartment protein [Candidatus Hydrogenedentota bacterium]
MKIGKVVGTVVATRKTEKLIGYKFLLVEILKADSTPTGTHVVAVDVVDAGAGEVILLVEGSSARMAMPVDGLPVDAAICAVIDSIRIGDKEIKFQKD